MPVPARGKNQATYSHKEGLLLSSESEAIVRETLPAVKAHGEAIAKEMYRTLLSENPSLRDVFNSGNQTNGEQQQALAASVVAGAEFLLGNNSIPFGNILARVAHKHASIAIRPDQYPLIGRHLMRAVGTVLAEAVTAEVAAAWDEVYWLFACHLIAAEGRLYQQAGVDENDAWSKWTIQDRIADVEDVVSFVLKPTEGKKAPDFKPGQYVSILVSLPNGTRQPRQYSLSQAPGLDTFKITLKRTRSENGLPEGTVSTYLADNLNAGDEIMLSEPFGDVYLNEAQTPVVVISAGIGVTPMVSIVEHIGRSSPQRAVVAVHADRSALTHPLKDEMEKASSQIALFESLRWYENLSGQDDGALQGYIDPELIPLPDDADIYMCGSIAFMRHVRRGLISRGIDEARIRYEVFGPDLWTSEPELS